MSGIINPTTGRTVQHDRYLEMLDAWLRDRRVMHAATVEGLVNPAFVKQAWQVVRAKRLSEQTAALWIKLFCQARRTRRQCARVVHELHGVPIRQALRDLRGMKGDEPS